MDYNLQQNLEYCYQFFLDDRGLLLYTHIPPIVVALLFAAFIVYHKRDRISFLLSGIALTFSAYATLDLLQWIRIDSSSFIMASWSVLGLLTAFLFFLTHWFVHEFTREQRLPRWMEGIWLLAFIPVVVFTPTDFNVSGYDLRDCIAYEGVWFTYYYYSLGVLAILLSAWSVFGRRNHAGDERDSRRGHIIVFVGASLFVATFLVTGLLASYLVDSGYIPDFGLAQYGIAAMSVFIGFLAYVTAYYRGFHLRALSVQLLVAALIILIGAEFLFVTSWLNRALVAITFVLSILFGLMLIRSVKLEIRQRELIERQEKELEAANRQQEILLHFITHEIKGYLTSGQNAFAGILEGDYGQPPAPMRNLAQEALGKMRQGVETVMGILEASNLKKGTVMYKHIAFDLKTVVESAVETMRPVAAERGLTLELTVDATKEYRMTGDQEKLTQHVIRNLIDNAIRYTPKGSIHVTLTRGAMIRFSVKDTGVGITSEDMAHLFTEGGHGKDSIKINVDSTGYGLYIAKQVTQVHGGKIWAESAGAGKGAEFIVELPVK